MQGDFSRTTFDRAKHYAAPLFQQGRVTLDADINEQTSALLYQLRTAIGDLVGPSAVPPGPAGGFAVTPTTDANGDTDLDVSAGRLYAEGVLVENEAETTYWSQPDAYLDPDDENDQLPAAPYLVYLRVWERIVSPIQDPSIREIALGDLAPDTTARRKVVWQVVASSATPSDESAHFPDKADAWLEDNLRRHVDDDLPLLQAEVPPNTSDAACDISPDSRYRGPENQLYRVEVHSPGTAADSNEGNGSATFKFSRENGSVTVPIASMAGNAITLAELGRDRKLGLEVGDLVEIADDRYDLRVRERAEDVTSALRRIVSIDTADRIVTVEDPPDTDQSTTGATAAYHPYLRRWDHSLWADDHAEPRDALADDGAIPIVEGTAIPLEDGIQVTFAQDSKKRPHEYRRGDYWLIPARTIPGDVLWPTDDTGQPAFRPPDGVEFRYAPLFWVVDTDGQDLRGSTRPTVSSGLIEPESSASSIVAPAQPSTTTAKKATSSTTAATAKKATAKKATPRKRPTPKKAT